MPGTRGRSRWLIPLALAGVLTTVRQALLARNDRRHPPVARAGGTQD